MNESVPSVIFGALVSAVIFASAGCALARKPLSDVSVRDAQLQKSVTLAAGRYSMILEQLDAGNIDQARRSLDWWVDLSILELAALDVRDPRKDWSEAMINSNSELDMRTFYKRIAGYRKSHPRIHLVPLDPSELKQIDVFVERYH